MPLPTVLTFATDICETSSTTGTGTYSLNGARTGYRSFAEGYDTNDTPYYVVRNAADTKYEHNKGGIFTDGSPDTLTRSVLYSSNSGAPVSWISGDLPLNVYVPNAAEVLEFMIRGWVANSRSIWLKFGQWFDSSVSNVATWNIYDGGADVKIADIDLVNHIAKLDWRVFPAGMEFVWSNTTVPAGLLEQAGQSLLRASYPALFAHYGTTFGSVDGTHFNLPDQGSRTVFGRKSASTIFDYAGRNTIGTAIGAQYHIHSVNVTSVGVSGGTSGSLSVSGSFSGSGGYIGGSVTNVNASGPVPTIDTSIVVGVSGSISGGTSGSLGVSASGTGGGVTDFRDNVSPGLIKMWVVTTGGV